MAELDDETLERVRRWCAEAGRQAGTTEIRRAFAPLSWDELLHARALLADPPPARPLGPAALADVVRGTPPDVAAEREREGRYRSEVEEPAEGAPAEAQAAAPSTAKRARRSGPRRPSPPVIHRRRDRAEPTPPASPAVPSFERLLDPPGRAVLERLVRKHGARRSFLLGELSSWRTAHGGAPSDEDLTALLEHHGMARAFAHRERDELLHALRAARGDHTGAAARVGLERPAYERALERLRATADAERLREDRRAELRARATITERCRLLAAESDHLADLGILEELEADLRVRLAEHLRALRAGSGPGSVAVAFARSVSLEVPDAVALARRLGVELAGAHERERPSAATRTPSRPSTPPRTPSRSAPRPGPRPGQRSGQRSGGPRDAARPRKEGMTYAPARGAGGERRPTSRKPGPSRGGPRSPGGAARPLTEGGRRPPRPGTPRRPPRTGPRERK